MPPTGWVAERVLRTCPSREDALKLLAEEEHRCQWVEPYAFLKVLFDQPLRLVVVNTKASLRVARVGLAGAGWRRTQQEVRKSQSAAWPTAFQEPPCDDP